MRTNDRTGELSTLFLAGTLLSEGYAYAWVQRIGNVSLGKLKADTSYSPFDFLEARFFTPGKELHLFFCDDTLRAVETVREDSDICANDCRDAVISENYVTTGSIFIREKQLLRMKYGKSLTLCHYLCFDEDGQAMVQRTVFDAYEGGDEYA